MRKVLLADIIIDPQVQIRDGLNRDKVEEYAQVLDQLPPVALFEEDGRLYLGDGFHRIESARLAGRESIEATVSLGGRAAALEHAARANAKHGIPLTNAEKARAVKRLLGLHPEWSDNLIAKELGVSDHTVRKYRRELESTSQIAKLDVRQGADGKMRPASVQCQTEPETRPVTVREHVREIPIRNGGNHVATITMSEESEAEPDEVERLGPGDYVYRVNGQVVGHAGSYTEALERRTQAVSRMLKDASPEKPPGLSLGVPGQAQVDPQEIAERASAIYVEKARARGRQNLIPKDGGDVYGPEDVENILEALWAVAAELSQRQKQEKKQEQPTSPMEQLYQGLRLLTPDRIVGGR